MNVAIVGCGHIAATHALALRGLGQRLYLCVDRRRENAEKFARLHGFLHSSDTFEEALGAEVDCIHLCTPPTLHYEMAKAALLAGKHLVCEKPLCLNPAEAKELYELAEQQKLLGAVNFNVRYNAACHSARLLVAEPVFGPLRLLSGSYKQQFHTLPTAYSWRYQPALSGKMRAVTEIGSHLIDLARYWTGLEVEAVSATLGRFEPQRLLQDGVMYPFTEAKKAADEKTVGVESEDAALLSLRFTGGALGCFLLSEVSHGHSNELRLEVNGRDGSVWWNSEEPYKLHQSRGGEIRTQCNAFAGGFPESFTAFFTDVYGALQKDGPPPPGLPTFYDGWKNAAVCEAIWQSDQKASAWVRVL